MDFNRKFFNLIRKHCDQGTWTGEHQSGKPVMLWGGEMVDVTPHAARMGIDLSTKYRYTEHGDMERQDPGADPAESGDGTGESQE